MAKTARKLARPSDMARTAWPRRRHGTVAVLTLFASAVHADEITSTRCSVSFKSGDPGTPNPTDKFHVNDVADCQFQCDLFSTFGSCSWFIYVKSGEDENCALYGPRGWNQWRIGLRPTTFGDSRF